MLSAISPFVLLQKPVFSPRIFLSFTVFFMYIAFLLNQFSLAKFFMIPLLFFIISFSYGYGNLLHRENLHDQYIAQSITYDLNQLENRNGINYNEITIIGRDSGTLELQRQIKKRPLMASLIPIYMKSDWYWAGRYLDYYRNVSTKLINKKEADDIWIKDREPDISNEFYNLYGNNNKMIIVLKKNNRNL